MRFLFVGGPWDGCTEDVPDDCGDTYHVRRIRPPAFVEASEFGVPDDSPDDFVAYRRRGHGTDVAFCAPGIRQDSVHWVVEELAGRRRRTGEPWRDLERVDGVPYCWRYRTGDPEWGHLQMVTHILGDQVDDGAHVTHRLPLYDYDHMGRSGMDVSAEIARDLGHELEYHRLPACFVAGCTQKATGGEVNGLWKLRADWRAPWELLGPARACASHFSDLLKMPPMFGDPFGGLTEDQVPAWLRPYLRDNTLNAWDRAMDILTTPAREYAVRITYRHAFSDAWVTAEDYFGSGLRGALGGQ